MTTTNSSPPTNEMMELATSINIDSTALDAALASALQPCFFSTVDLLDLATNLKLEDVFSLDLFLAHPNLTMG